MKADLFIKTLSESAGVSLFTGVPDSLLGPFCDCLRAEDAPVSHLTAPNEGSAVAIACGHHLATDRLACVYMQNSGIGNAVNPILSLAHPDVYGIPLLLVVGWRGAPGQKDEPQHAAQGRLTVRLLESLELTVHAFGPQTTLDELKAWLADSRKLFAQGRSVALVVEKGAIEPSGPSAPHNPYELPREEAIGTVLEAAAPDDLFVSTTGKISRELFELRKARGEENRDFLTVGSMGHSSMIALAVALRTPRRVWCLDGDGAFLMHMGGAALIGRLGPKNLVHVALDNAAHDSVGGMPTAAPGADIAAIATASGYGRAFSVTDREGLAKALSLALASDGPTMIAAKVALGSRPDLGRPTLTPRQNKENFMKLIKP
ncbi:MAG: phosphonopyruvate decarboxylase [Deltaproteobacteria bacterium]|jgi:phosphonopyruvate decarboxylase|nr:phosphonopyruvate decarboxylase [Deltaproteobacteria bacterium]